MGPIGGWNIWTKSGNRIRQFAVAFVAELEAVARVQADNPDLEVHSRHPLDADTITLLGMAVGDITVWVPLDCKEKLRLMNSNGAARSVTRQACSIGSSSL